MGVAEGFNGTLVIEGTTDGTFETDGPVVNVAEGATEVYAGDGLPEIAKDGTTLSIGTADTMGVDGTGDNGGQGFTVGFGISEGLGDVDGEGMIEPPPPIPEISSFKTCIIK